MSGCVQPKREKVPVQILDRELLAKAKVLQADTMGTFDEFIYAKKFWVYADSILIVLNKKHKDGYFVELHNLFTKENIVKLYRFGDGPDEMLSARVDMNGKTLLVNDFVKGQVAVVNLDSLLKILHIQLFLFDIGQSEVLLPYLMAIAFCWKIHTVLLMRI